MKKKLVLLLLMVFLISCSTKQYSKGRVQVIFDSSLYKDNIVNSKDINRLLTNQTRNIAELEKTWGINYRKVLKIYLYDKETGKKNYNIDYGGFVEKDNGEYVIRYIVPHKSIFDQTRNEYDLLGMHETAHAVLFSCIGFSDNKVINEGLAVYSDGNYGSRSTVDGVVRNTIYSLQNNEIELSIAAILNGNHNEETQYPQSGIFIDWILTRSDCNFIREIYFMNKEEIIQKLKEKSKKEYNDLEKDFEMFRDNRIKKEKM